MATILKFLCNGDGFVAIHSVAQSEDISADGIKVYGIHQSRNSSQMLWVLVSSLERSSPELAPYPLWNLEEL